MKKMTTILERLDELKRIADAATPGPWDPWIVTRILFKSDPNRPLEGIHKTNAEFIATSRTALPQLVEALLVAVVALSDAKWAEKMLARPNQCEQALTRIAILLEVTG